MKKIFFDIGANNGTTSIPVAQQQPNTDVYAFEPTPEMIQIIKEKSKELSNYNLIPKAVSDYNGSAIFNVAGNSDWGCSSLLDFSENSKKLWPGRTDFNVTHKINVEVIRLDTFITNYNISKIDWLHVDTQGSDLKVLYGLGEKIEIVLGGVIEAANKIDILYNGQNTKEECINFLKSKGFFITGLEYNDQFENEINIFFAKDESYKNFWNS